MQGDKLLTQYAYDGSEAAFGQIVARHLTLVYSTCLRDTGSPSQAEDAAQVVFLILARKAKSLRAGPSDAAASYTLSETPPTQEAEALVFAATPHINGDNSVAIALSPVFSISGVRHEVNTLRTVKNGDTMVIVMPPIASQPDGKDLLLFVTPTIK